MTVRAVLDARLWAGVAVLMFSIAGCGPSSNAPDASEQVLQARTVDGLKIGDPVMRAVRPAVGEDVRPQEVGRVVRLSPMIDQVEVTVRFESPVQVFRSTRFELAGGEGNRRFIYMTDMDPPGLPVNAGEKMPIDIPSEMLEDRLWVVR